MTLGSRSQVACELSGGWCSPEGLVLREAWQTQLTFPSVTLIKVGLTMKSARGETGASLRRGL